jgi:hypothetical protein
MTVIVFITTTMNVGDSCVTTRMVNPLAGLSFLSLSLSLSWACG